MSICQYLCDDSTVLYQNSHRHSTIRILWVLVALCILLISEFTGSLVEKQVCSNEDVWRKKADVIIRNCLESCFVLTNPSRSRAALQPWAELYPNCNGLEMRCWWYQLVNEHRNLEPGQKSKASLEASPLTWYLLQLWRRFRAIQMREVTYS